MSRRATPAAELPADVRFGPFVFDTARRELKRGEEIVRKDEDYTTAEGSRKASVPSSGPSKKDKDSSGIGGIEPQPES